MAPAPAVAATRRMSLPPYPPPRSPGHALPAAQPWYIPCGNGLDAAPAGWSVLELHGPLWAEYRWRPGGIRPGRVGKAGGRRKRALGRDRPAARHPRGLKTTASTKAGPNARQAATTAARQLAASGRPAVFSGRQYAHSELSVLMHVMTLIRLTFAANFPEPGHAEARGPS